MPCRRVISDNIASPMPISPMIARFCVTLQLRRVEAITPSAGTRRPWPEAYGSCPKTKTGRVALRRCTAAVLTACSHRIRIQNAKTPHHLRCGVSTNISRGVSIAGTPACQFPSMTVKLCSADLAATYSPKS